MSASFYERILLLGDYENDGGAVDVGELQTSLVLFEASLMSAAQIKTQFSCTSAQGDDVDEILATMPGTILTALSAVTRARWVALVYNVFKLGTQGDTRFDTVAECKAALGIA